MRNYRWCRNAQMVKFLFRLLKYIASYPMDSNSFLSVDITRGDDGRIVWHASYLKRFFFHLDIPNTFHGEVLSL